MCVELCYIFISFCSCVNISMFYECRKGTENYFYYLFRFEIQTFFENEVIWMLEYGGHQCVTLM